MADSDVVFVLDVEGANSVDSPGCRIAGRLGAGWYVKAGLPRVGHRVGGPPSGNCKQLRDERVGAGILVVRVAQRDPDPVPKAVVCEERRFGLAAIAADPVAFVTQRQ